MKPPSRLRPIGSSTALRMVAGAGSGAGVQTV